MLCPFDGNCVNIDNTEPPILTEESVFPEQSLRIPWLLALSSAEINLNDPSKEGQIKTRIISRLPIVNLLSPALTISGMVLKKSDDLVKVRVTFNSKMTFEKHLRSVSRAASQRLGILRKPWQLFYDRLHLGRCFRGFVLPVLVYCSAVWCSAADTHLKLLDRVVSGASFLTGGVFVCDRAHRRSVAVLCMLSKIRCNPIHSLYGALHDPYVPVRVPLCAVIAHRYTYAPPRCRTYQYGRTFILPCVSLWNNLGDPIFDGVKLVQCFSRAGSMLFYWPCC